ncbi:hypothetical protein FSP39_001171 [Pinctada imbricata]|uniref:Phenylalanine--tRNA ligase, mitochondrial n=1 Tax=Pinctada imbricata TaxID=66713 RepID=A0AA88XM12_PINIB|nr:hypothetical protein FSP39_001171 [Pinctada imbricata]
MKTILRQALCLRIGRTCCIKTSAFNYMSTTVTGQKSLSENVEILGKTYKKDEFTNVTKNILQKLDRNLHNQHCHPLNLIRKRIEMFFYRNYLNKWRSQIFSVYDSLSPVVTVEQNFDSLLVPVDHVCRSVSDNYYINRKHLLRAHTSAHQRDLVKSGLDAFLVVGDVYRRDTIDASHYPVFHQMEGVRLFTSNELYGLLGMHRLPQQFLILEDGGARTKQKQSQHRPETAKLLELNLKSTLEKLAYHLFGNEIEVQWVDAYFPFTHPSWELEIKFHGEWLEVLGCGVMEQEILDEAGALGKVGWAFGLGLERLAMKLYNIPDIRLFWSQDPGFLRQFEVEDPQTSIEFKPFSKCSPCTNDISFWIPENYSENDFYDMVRNIGGDLVESVSKFDEFLHPKEQRTSHAYRIVYRHMERPLSQEEVNVIHEKIEKTVTDKLGVEIR